MRCDLTRNSRSRGFTMVEVCVGVVIVSVMLAAALQTVGQANISQFRLNERARGMQLARMLMAEIMQQSYFDPAIQGTFGTGPGEVRATFNDVDDYAGYTESPPTNKDGSSIDLPDPSNWRRTVTGVWADPVTLAAASPQVESGVKKMTVNVYHRGYLVATLTAVRTNAP